MAFEEGTAKTSDFIVKSLVPDFCLSPGAPVPYDIVGFLDESIMTSPNVRFKGFPVFDMASRVTTVWGDELGIGGGVISGVNKGMCRPFIPVTTVRCNGFLTCRHHKTLFFMNCAGPEGPGNTIGEVIFLGAMAPGPVGPCGVLPPNANSIVAPQTPGEIGCLPDLGSMADGLGSSIDDMVDLAQKAYQLSQVDWSNPQAALGAIAGVAGMAGFPEIADAMNMANKAVGIAKSGLSNPGALLDAAMGLAGPLMESLPTFGENDQSMVSNIVPGTQTTIDGHQVIFKDSEELVKEDEKYRVEDTVPQDSEKQTTIDGHQVIFKDSEELIKEDEKYRVEDTVPGHAEPTNDEAPRPGTYPELDIPDEELDAEEEEGFMTTDGPTQTNQPDFESNEPIEIPHDVIDEDGDGVDDRLAAEQEDFMEDWDEEEGIDDVRDDEGMISDEQYGDEQYGDGPDYEPAYDADPYGDEAFDDEAYDDDQYF